MLSIYRALLLTFAAAAAVAASDGLPMARAPADCRHPSSAAYARACREAGTQMAVAHSEAAVVRTIAAGGEDATPVGAMATLVAAGGDLVAGGRALLKRKWRRGSRGSSRASKLKKRRGKGKKKGRRKGKSKKGRKKGKKGKKSKGKSKGKKGRKSKSKPRKSSRKSKRGKKKPTAAVKGAFSGSSGGSSGGSGGGSGGKATGGSKLAMGTHFDGMGTPTGGCGVPPSKAKDDNGKPLPFVALNTNSEFSNGGNCGRWIEITLGDNCVGGGNAQWSVCNGGSFKGDSRSGKKIYGYVMDSCGDNNYWCQDDKYHLDISKSYLSGLGLVGSAFNARKLNWRYMSGTAPGWQMSKPKFMWMKDSKWEPNGYGFWAGLVIYNTANGIGSVEQKIGSGWQKVSQVTHLGNTAQLKPPANYRNPRGGAGQHLEVRVKDKSGKSYGEFKVKFTCNGRCSKNTDAPAY